MKLSLCAALSVSALLSGACSRDGTTPPAVTPQDSVPVPAPPVSIAFSPAPSLFISAPGDGRMNVYVTQDNKPIQDTLTLAVVVTGPFTLGWESSRWELRTLKVTATAPGAGTVTVTTRGKSASFDVTAEAVTFKRVARTGGNGCGLTPDDRVWCWGGNYTRQLGRWTPYQCSGGACQYASVYPSESPVKVESDVAFSQIAVGSYERMRQFRDEDLLLGRGTRQPEAHPVGFTASRTA